MGEGARSSSELDSTRPRTASAVDEGLGLVSVDAAHITRRGSAIASDSEGYSCLTDDSSDGSNISDGGIQGYEAEFEAEIQPNSAPTLSGRTVPSGVMETADSTLLGGDDDDFIRRLLARGEESPLPVAPHNNHISSLRKDAARNLQAIIPTIICITPRYQSSNMPSAKLRYDLLQCCTR